jgi:hypothetical protein
VAEKLPPLFLPECVYSRARREVYEGVSLSPSTECVYSRVRREVYEGVSLSPSTE